jgi:hypothetical protein
MIDLGGIGALISAFTGLLVAAGSILLQRQRRSVVDTDEMEDELEVRTRQFQAALRYIRVLEDDRAAHTTLPPPRRPAELRPGYFQTQQRGGRRRRREEQQADEGGADEVAGTQDAGAGGGGATAR